MLQNARVVQNLGTNIASNLTLRVRRFFLISNPAFISPDSPSYLSHGKRSLEREKSLKFPKSLSRSQASERKGLEEKEENYSGQAM